jgi:hypothetical protein
MASSFQELFTPIFIIISLFIFIAGIVGMQFLDKIFAGSKNLNAIRMFALCLIINFIILFFIIMSFSKVKFSAGLQGPQGNKGERGNEGIAGGLAVCTVKARTAQEQKAHVRSANYLDMKPPFLEDV